VPFSASCDALRVSRERCRLSGRGFEASSSAWCRMVSLAEREAEIGDRASGMQSSERSGGIGATESGDAGSMTKLGPRTGSGGLDQVNDEFGVLRMIDETTANDGAAGDVNSVSSSTNNNIRGTNTDNQPWPGSARSAVSSAAVGDASSPLGFGSPFSPEELPRGPRNGEGKKSRRWTVNVPSLSHFESKQTDGGENLFDLQLPPLTESNDHYTNEPLSGDSATFLNEDYAAQIDGIEREERMLEAKLAKLRQQKQELMKLSGAPSLSPPPPPSPPPSPPGGPLSARRFSALDVGSNGWTTGPLNASLAASLANSSRMDVATSFDDDFSAPPLHLNGGGFGSSSLDSGRSRRHTIIGSPAEVNHAGFSTFADEDQSGSTNNSKDQEIMREGTELDGQMPPPPPPPPVILGGSGASDIHTAGVYSQANAAGYYSMPHQPMMGQPSGYFYPPQPHYEGSEGHVPPHHGGAPRSMPPGISGNHHHHHHQQQQQQPPQQQQTSSNQPLEKQQGGSAPAHHTSQRSNNASTSGSGTPNAGVSSQSNSNAQKQATGPSGANIFVFNFPRSFEDGDLEAAFAPYGNILSATVFIDKVTGKSKCFGFVSFDDPASAQEAIKNMNGATLGGKLIKVQIKRERNRNASQDKEDS